MSQKFNCISIDLEIVGSGQIHAIGAVNHISGKSLTFKKGKFRLNAALDELDDFVEGADFILGHNIINHDLQFLASANPELRLLKLPVIDTLKLSPLAFPRNPYHHLVKHYQDGGIRRGRINDPELDARLALEVFEDEFSALRTMIPEQLTAWHWLCTPEFDKIDSALDDFFSKIRGSDRPNQNAVLDSVTKCLKGSGCPAHGQKVVENIEKVRWELAYALAWFSVAGGNSVLPPWVRHQFPKTGGLIRRLRDTSCSNSSCKWCSERHDAVKELKRWFGFESYRPEPADESGNSLQQAIVEASMAREHVLGILPTGTGKSICFQIPALSRFDKTGSLTVVISPLVALMADQVDGLVGRGISSCTTINSLLSMPERSDRLDQVRLGDAGILLISPEQLRSTSIRRVLEQREIGGWVLDEAHCLSRWGHDFRPDYRYVGRFIRESAESKRIPPIMCLTATAKPDVVEDIEEHFKEELNIALKVFPGGAERKNLTFEVIPTDDPEKYSDIHQVLSKYLPTGSHGGAIIYCATRRRCEEVSEYLQLKDLEVEYFHAGLSPERKKEVQNRFIGNELRVIAATNAFGMGVDKPNVRLIIHADIPGSLENYLQEAGRAGRDQEPAHCVLMYTIKDVERQFSMSAYTRLTRSEIHGILRALRKLDYRVRRHNPESELVATAGEILEEDEEHTFNRDSATDDTRVRTAVAWLEESELLRREENLVSIFPSSLRVNSIEAAEKKLADMKVAETYRQQLIRIAEALINSDVDEGISTDELMGLTGLKTNELRSAMYDLEKRDVVKDDTKITVFVHSGVERSSKKRFENSEELEVKLISHMRENAPELTKGETSNLYLRQASETLREQGVVDPLPEKLRRIVAGISYDGRGEDNMEGSISIRRRDLETIIVTLKRSWNALEETAKLRRHASELLLNHLLSCLDPENRGVDLLVETTMGSLNEVLDSDINLKSKFKNRDKLLDRSLLWLHEQEVIRLNKGLVVFRPAMKIHMDRQEKKRGFTNADFKPLEIHYQGKVLQIHVMKEFAERGLEKTSDAVALAMDYFSMPEEKFIGRWLPGREKEIGRETTPESWKRIVEDLHNANQQNIVADQREETNVLVLAGPGSGKTRVLVHRIAYLIRAKRERPDSILALTYNRHAAVEIRQRLVDLIGEDSRRVTVLTCHGLAMRLVGLSFTSKVDQPDDKMFAEILKYAIRLLKGGDLPPEDADDQRERLLAGFRWILVDEYQDINGEQYELISALAGRSKDEDSHKLTIFAVGDDDQNIYSFNGASVEFIRNFETDFGPKPKYLTSNYRSTGHIIQAANLMIKPAKNRMKDEHPIRINKKRTKDALGGRWQQIDPVVRGRVQIIEVNGDSKLQSLAVITEFERLSNLDSNWNWSKCAVIARNWKFLDPVRAICEHKGIPYQMADEEIPNFWRLRETRQFVRTLKDKSSKLVDTKELRKIMVGVTSNVWKELLIQAVDEHELETGGKETPTEIFFDWLAEWGCEIRKRQSGLLLLTGHRAKGLEFDHVAILDGGWDKIGKDEDVDAPRRLYYVAMTRARETLAVTRLKGQDNHLLDSLRVSSSIVKRTPAKLTNTISEFNRTWFRASLKHIDLSFAGRQNSNEPVHQAIANLSCGSELDVQFFENKWLLKSKSGMTVGKLSQHFRPPSKMKCHSAKVYALIERTKEMSEPEYLKNIRCESWEMVVPEMVFVPE